MVVSTRYNSQSNNIISYNWADIASGTGYVTYYLSMVRSDSGAGDAFSFILTPNQAPGYTSTTLGWTSTSTTNFDLTPFNRPAVVKGIAYFAGQINDEGEPDGIITSSLVHYDGTTETTIGTAVATLGEEGDVNFNLAFDVSEKQFKKGEILRLKVAISNSNTLISIDPSGVQPAGITPSRLDIPMETDQ